MSDATKSMPLSVSYTHLQTGSIFDEVEQMTDEMGDNGDILISDLRAMNDQMRSITVYLFVGE